MRPIAKFVSDVRRNQCCNDRLGLIDGFGLKLNLIQLPAPDCVIGEDINITVLGLTGTKSELGSMRLALAASI